MVGNNDAEEVEALNDDDPINLLIKAAYGLTDCEKVRRSKLVFNEEFLHLYAYLIVAVHRAIFEQGGKCVKELLDIMNYLEPYDHDSRVLRDFYNEVYARVIKRSGNYVDNVYEVYNEFKKYIESENSLSSQVIRISLGIMGVRGVVGDISDFFEPVIYVDFNDLSKEDAIKYLGYIPIEDVDERTVLNYYKDFARRIEGDIIRINRETIRIKLLMIGLRLVKWLNKSYKGKELVYLQDKIEKRIRVVKNKDFHDKITNVIY